MNRIVVVGACNMDLVSYVPRLPNMGETLHGERFQMGFGGKGANQAVMSAKLGAEVTLISKVGQDIFGEKTINNLKKYNISTEHVSVTDEGFTGVAPIAVDPDGNNAIIIVTGANDILSEQDILQARESIEKADVLICQLEIPEKITLKALEIAHKAETMTIFNPAPARKDLPEGFFEYSDILCPNENEAELLSGAPVDSISSAKNAGKILLSKGARSIVLTLGKKGSILIEKDNTKHFPAPEVEAVDTTGAGDAFIGSLGYYLSESGSIDDAIRKANIVASFSVQKPGTQASFPNAEDLKMLYNS